MAREGEFDYYVGIREDFGNMIKEIGRSCTVSVPTHTVDAWGNHTTSSYTDYTETIWIRPLNEVMEIQNVGQLNKEDIRFVAKYDTHIDVESKIVAGGVTYIVLSIDKPNTSGNLTTLVGYAKKEIT